MPNNKIIDLERLSRFKDKLDIELDKKANVDGNYPTMTVGFADNLTPYGDNSGIEDDTPFVFQTSGGESDIGSQAYLKSLRGNSIAFNQTAQLTIRSSATVRAITFTNNGDNTLSISGTSEQGESFAIGTFKLVQGHKYLGKTRFISGTASATTFYVKWATVNYGVDIGNGLLFTATSSNDSAYIMFSIYSSEIAVDCKISLNIFDLTLMFGAGNEPTSVEEFNRLFPKPYYEYNAGELLSCKSNGYKTVGYNAFDGELEQGSIGPTGQEQTSNQACRSKNYIKVVAGQQYTMEWGVAGDTTRAKYVCEYDENKNFIDRTLVPISMTLKNNTYYVRIYCYKTDQNITPATTGNVAFHLTWDNSRTGYEPYESNTYPLPNVELRSAGSAFDELRPDGNLIRRIGVVDLGTLTWNKYETGGNYIFYANVSGGRTSVGYQNPIGILCSNYVSNTTAMTGGYSASGNDKTASWDANNSQVLIKDTTYSDAATFKTAMSGVYLYYELATPTTEQTEYTFAETTPIDDYGTQEFLYDSDIDIPIPQGNEFFYPVDYKAFIDSLGGRDDIEYDANEIVSKTELESAIAFKELESSNIGAITSSQVVAGEFYKNNIAITGGLTNAKYVIAVMSNGNKYPMIITSSLLVTYSGTSWQASNLTVTKIYYKE